MDASQPQVLRLTFAHASGTKRAFRVETLSSADACDAVEKNRTHKKFVKSSKCDALNSKTEVRVEHC